MARRRAEAVVEEPEAEVPAAKPGFFQRILDVFRRLAKKAPRD